MEKLAHPSWLLLPHDIQWMIIQRLDFIDCHSLSAVCRYYRSFCKSDHGRFLFPNDQIPWLYIRRTNNNSLVELYRPSTDKTYIRDVPQIQNTECYYSNDGWLLLRGSGYYHDLFLFNLFSMQKVDLPLLKAKKQWGHKATFSTHEKQPNFVIVILHHSESFSIIYAWTKGASTWKQCDFDLGVESSIIYTWLSDDLLYCYTANKEDYCFDKDLNLKRTNSLMKILDCYGEKNTTMDVTLDIVLCNNELYYKSQDCIKEDDARNSIWFFNKGGRRSSGVMIKGNLNSTESLLSNLTNKGCYIYTVAERFTKVVNNGDDVGTNNSIDVRFPMAEIFDDWTWINLQ